MFILFYSSSRAIRGVGLWILKRMEEFFSNTTTEKLPQKGASSSSSRTSSLCSLDYYFLFLEVGLSSSGKRAKGSKPYLPKKKSVAYALLITLYR